MGFFLDTFTKDIVLVLMLLVIYVYLKFKHALCYWKRKGVPYLPPNFPLGNLNSRSVFYSGHVVCDICQKLKQAGAKFCGIYLFHRPVFIPLDPELIKTILVKEFNKFTDRGFYCNEDVDPMTANILCYGGKKWRDSRSKLSPTLTASKVKVTFPSYVKCNEDMTAVVESHYVSCKPFNIREFSERYILDVLALSGFGVDTNCLHNPNSDFQKYASMLIGDTFLETLRFLFVIMAPEFLEFLKIRAFPAEAANFFDKFVKEVIHYRMENNVVRLDFLGSLLAISNSDGSLTKKLTNDEIAAQGFMFVIASFETSSITLTMALYELSVNPHLQTKLRKEIDSVLEKYNKELTYDNVMEMTYLHKVVSETLRKHSASFFIKRICNEDFQIPGTDIVVEQGTDVFIPQYLLHRDEEYYPQPDIFDPERFSDEGVAKRHPLTFLPFGVGPRICIGMRMGLLHVKMGIIAIVKNYKLSLHPSTTTPLDLLSKANILKSRHDIWLNVEKCY